MNLIISIVTWLFIAFTPFGDLIEKSLLLHVLFGVPVLIGIGIVFGVYINKYCSQTIDIINYAGIPGIVLATFTIGFWMIPRWLDASINDEYIGLIKYFSLTMLVGLPLSLSWKRLPIIAVGVVKIEFLAMLFRIGWIYEISPVRLCNNYLLFEQQLLGTSFIYIGLILGLIWTLTVFFSTVSHEASFNYN